MDEAPQLLTMVDGEDLTSALEGSPKPCFSCPRSLQYHPFPPAEDRLLTPPAPGVRCRAGLPDHFYTTSISENLLAAFHAPDRLFLLPDSNTSTLFIYSSTEPPTELKPALGSLLPWTSLSCVLPWPFIPFLDLFPVSSVSPLPLCQLPSAQMCTEWAEQGMLCQLLAGIRCSQRLMLLVLNSIKKSHEGKKHHNEPSGVKDVFQRHSHVFLIQLVFPHCVLTFWVFVRGVLLGHLS